MEGIRELTIEVDSYIKNIISRRSTIKTVGGEFMSVGDIINQVVMLLSDECVVNSIKNLLQVKNSSPYTSTMTIEIDIRHYNNIMRVSKNINMDIKDVFVNALRYFIYITEADFNYVDEVAIYGNYEYRNKIRNYYTTNNLL